MNHQHEKINDDMLVGRKIIAVKQNSQESVVFTTDAGNITLVFEQVCCAEAFIYGMDGDITGEVVTKVEISDGNDFEDEETIIARIKTLFGGCRVQSHQKLWNVDVFAGEKRLRIFHCNTSNGYYDSTATWYADGDPYNPRPITYCETS